MAHHKDHEKLERIKEAIARSDLKEEEKSNALAHVEEWYAEDRGAGTLVEMLLERFATLKPILAEAGLL